MISWKRPVTGKRWPSPAGRLPWVAAVAALVVLSSSSEAAHAAPPGEPGKRDSSLGAAAPNQPGPDPASGPTVLGAPVPPSSPASPTPAPVAAPPTPTAPAVTAVPAALGPNGPVPEGTASVAAGPAPSGRGGPGISAAVGMGVSFDGTGLVRGRTEPVPAFYAQVGVGAGLLGVETRLCSTQASGRYFDRDTTGGGNGQQLIDMPVDRLAVDLVLALRPWASGQPVDSSWISRAISTVTFNVGIAGENAAISQRSALRLGAVIGGHVDFELAPVDSGASPVRLRVTMRRMLAGDAVVRSVTVSDTALEAFAGLALVL